MNRPLTDQEKRTIRWGTVVVVIYLALFFGRSVWQSMDARRAEYQARVQEARALSQVIAPYQEKVLVAKKMMEDFHLDPAKLKRSSVVADASAAIQKAAAAGGVGVGPIRESPGRLSTREIASISFEGTGPIPAILALLHNLESLGYPLVIDTLQFSPDPHNPSAIKVNLTIVVLDFDAWKKKEEKPNA
jgi:hypothetical protein